MKIRLDIPYPKRIIAPAGQEPITSADLSARVCYAAVNLKHKSLAMKEARVWAKIQDKMADQDGNAVAGEIELTETQFEFLYRAVMDADYPPGFSGAAVVFADALEAVKNAAEPTVDGS